MIYKCQQGSQSDLKSEKNWKSEITFFSHGKINEFDNFEKKIREKLDNLLTLAKIQGKIRELDLFCKI